MMRLLSITALIMLCACQAISDGANHLGSYMPVIGERCEHWQCITGSGQEKSEMSKQQSESATGEDETQPEERKPLPPPAQ